MKRILVVDDDAIVRRTVERILSRGGYEVITAKDVAESSRYATEIQFQAAIVDYALEHEDGLQVLSKLREMQPSCLRILMTGRTDFPMVVEAVNCGEVLRVIRKPFEATTLLEIVSGAFEAAQRMAQVASAQQLATNHREQTMLRDAIEQNLLRLALQPIVKPDGVAIAYEALLRSTHPVLDGPLAILNVAERSNTISTVGKKVFALAGEVLESLKSDVGLFVNLHPLQLVDPEHLEKSLSPLSGYEEQVTVEITERSRLHDIARWEESLDVLVTRGFSLAIDDLGAGYNSLTMLADLQPRYIKLDMSLVRNVHVEPRKRRLVQLMATFAEATGAQLIGEGVETPDEARCLVDCGVHLLQGFFFGRPAFDPRPDHRN